MRAGPSDLDTTSAPIMIGSEIYRRSTYGDRHPLAIPRVSTAIDLCRALGWLDGANYLDSPKATPEELQRFHDPDYIAAVQRAEARQRVDEETKRRYGLGANGNPVFPEVFSRPATACGASLLAAELLRAGGLAHNPAGGTHHGRPDRASGFCYFNDPVLAIRAFLNQGLKRVAYLDLDAHHGDGVQAAVAEDPRVRFISIHEAGRWPMTGDPAGEVTGELHDRGLGNCLNLPVPPGFHDSELDFLMELVIAPALEDFQPEALIIQGGVDGLDDDPLSKLSLTNTALWRAVAMVKPLAPRLLMLGGGGYNPWSVGRAWAGFWAVLNGFDIPPRLPPQAEAVLRGLSWRHSKGRNPPAHWFEALADPPRPEAIRPELRELAREALSLP